MKLIYLTTLTYPSTYANRLQVIKMSEAFSGLVDFKLFVGELRKDINEIFKFYGIRKHFQIKAIGPFKTKPRALRAALTFRKVIAKERPDAVFYIREAMPAFFLSFVSKNFRNNFFFEAHSFHRHPKFIYQRIFNLAKGVIVTNRKKYEVFRELFKVPRHKIIVRQNAIDLDDFKNLPSKEEARLRLSLPEHKKMVVFIGKPTADRGIYTLLEVAHMLGDQILFMAVGGSKEEINLLRQTPGFNNIRFISHVPHNDIPWYMSAADILVAPQSGKFREYSKYASPLKVSEYLASGRPVILSQTLSMQEMAEGKPVIFAKPDNPEDWAEKINFVFEHYNQMQAKAAKAREAALRNNWAQRAKDVLDFICSKIDIA